MATPIDSRPTPWTTILLVCGKCSRKLGGGFGPKGKATLRTAVKAELKDRGYRRAVRVMETKCFGLCPKNAVVIFNATLPGRLLTVAHRTSAGEALDALLDATPSPTTA